MNNPTLTDLRDIQIPEEIGLWPLAIGWYFVFALILLVLVVAIGYGIRRHFRLKSRCYAMRSLENLRERYRVEGDAVIIAAELSSLLRRASLVSFTRRRVAGLQGEQWLAFLDQTGNTHEFSQGIGRVLLTAPYQPRAQIDVQSLLDLAEDWVGQNAVKPSRGLEQ